jgi:hypothetical protein
MRCRITSINAVNFGTGIVLSLGIPTIYANQIETIVGDFRPNTEWELKPYKQKRSLSANAYLWVLADKIADKLKTTKENVYRQAIDHVGVFEEIKVISPEAGQRFKRIWQHNGLGWLTKTIDETTILAYYGSSTYDKAQMGQLIDLVVQECKQQGIETMTPRELALIKEAWDA